MGPEASTGRGPLRIAPLGRQEGGLLEPGRSAAPLPLVDRHPGLSPLGTGHLGRREWLTRTGRPDEGSMVHSGLRLGPWCVRARHQGTVGPLWPAGDIDRGQPERPSLLEGVLWSGPQREMGTEGICAAALMCYPQHHHVPKPGCGCAVALRPWVCPRSSLLPRTLVPRPHSSPSHPSWGYGTPGR